MTDSVYAAIVEGETKSDMISDRLAIVTGAAGVIGTATAERLCRSGYRVLCVDRQFKDSWPMKTSPGITMLEADLTNLSDLKETVKRVQMDDGRLSLLVNNAGADTKVSREEKGVLRSPIVELVEFNLDDFRNVLEINLLAPLRLVQLLAGEMRGSSNASIVNIASIYGIRSPNHDLYRNSQVSVFKGPDYPCSKAALISLSNYLAVTLAPWGIRSNAVSPGGVDTGLPDSFVRNYSAGTPLGRMATSSDVAEAVNFLASDAAAYVTGQNLVIDGGRSAW